MRFILRSILMILVLLAAGRSSMDNEELQLRLPASDEQSTQTSNQNNGNYVIDNPRPMHWPARVWRSIVQGADDAAYSLTHALFDAIKKFDFDLYKQDYYRLGLKVRRDVYDNQDVLNSYTVKDQFSLEAKSRNLTLKAPIATPNVSLGFSLGIGGTLQWMNIRQVTASRYAKLPTIDQEVTYLDEIGFTKKEVRKLRKEYRKKQKEMARERRSQDGDEDPDDPVFEPDPGGDVSEIDTYQSSQVLDPSLRPRLSRLWNPFVIPFKLPYNLKRLSKMEDGELVSWSVNGYIELGPDVGFNIAPFTGTDATLGVNAYFRTFLKGTFRVTILKENDRFVRVKLSKVRTKGYRLGLGGSGRDFELYEGFLIFEGSDFETRLLRQNISMIPFKFQLKKEKSNTFDVGYRFDLNYPEAVAAFKKTIWGSFHRAYELQGRRSGDDLVVERLFRKTAVNRARTFSQRLDLRFYTRNQGRRSESTNAIIQLPDGPRQVFKEVTTVDKNWKLAWGRFEKLNYVYTISLDKTSYLQGKPNSYQLIVEANIEDSHTTGQEMQYYTRTVEQALGNDQLLPDLPAFVPLYSRFNLDDDYIYPENIRLKKAKYRRSSFYYGFNISQAQIEKLIQVPEEQMWPILEKAFGVGKGRWATANRRRLYRLRNIWPTIANVPLYLANVHLRRGSNVEAAKKIYRAWRSLKASMTMDDEGKFLLDDEIDRKLKILSQMFNSKHHGHEMLKVLLHSLSQEELDYFLVATNDSFGRIQERGRVTTNPEYLLNLTDASMGFERLAGGFKSNPELVIKGLKMTVNEDESVKLDFNLNHDPKLVYFKIFKANRYQKYKVVAELVFKNKGRFKKGNNTVVMDKASLNELSYLLGKPLELNNFYNMTVSTSKDGFSWGKVASKRLHYVLPIPDDPDPDGPDKNKHFLQRDKNNGMPWNDVEVEETIYEWEKEDLKELGL
jgi:hypothetical protein